MNAKKQNQSPIKVLAAALACAVIFSGAPVYADSSTNGLQEHDTKTEMEQQYEARSMTVFDYNSLKAHKVVIPNSMKLEAPKLSFKQRSTSDKQEW